MCSNDRNMPASEVSGLEHPLPTRGWQYRVTAHDPETMGRVGGLSIPVPTQALAHGYMPEIRRKHPTALIVVARRTVNLAQTNDVGSWEIVRTDKP